MKYTVEDLYKMIDAFHVDDESEELKVWKEAFPSLNLLGVPNKLLVSPVLYEALQGLSHVAGLEVHLCTVLPQNTDFLPLYVPDLTMDIGVL